MSYAGFEGIRYLRYTATIPNEFKPKMAHLQRSNCLINTNLKNNLPQSEYDLSSQEISNIKRAITTLSRFSKMPENAKLILNPTSGAPGFSVDNVFCLPGVPSILKSMLGGLKNEIVGGEPILSHTISLKTVESEIANSLTKVQEDNKDVEIGSYPFFHAGKLGVSIVLRSENQSKIDTCNSQILAFIKEKNIEIVDR